VSCDPGLTGSAVRLSPPGLSTASTTDSIDVKMLQKAQDLAHRISVIDCHSHNLFQPESEARPKQADFSMLQGAGVNGVVQFVPLNASGVKNPTDDILRDIKEIRQRIRDDGLKVSVVLNSREMATSCKSDSSVVLIGLEYFKGIFDGDIGQVRRYYDAGVREIGLVRRGGSDSLFVDQNLTGFGVALVRELNRLGIICDITHMPESAQQQVIDVSDSPVILSHTAAFGLVKSEFNATDATLRRLAARGGMIGIGFFSGQLSNSSLAESGRGVAWDKLSRAKVEDLVDQIDYLRKIVGIDAIGIGSDYGGSGRRAPEGLETIEGFPLIIYHMLKRGYTENEIEKVMGVNFIRFFERVEKKTTLK
jgi:membrane dipeptidase